MLPTPGVNNHAEICSRAINHRKNLINLRSYAAERDYRKLSLQLNTLLTRLVSLLKCEKSITSQIISSVVLCCRSRTRGGGIYHRRKIINFNNVIKHFFRRVMKLYKNTDRLARNIIKLQCIHQTDQKLQRLR